MPIPLVFSDDAALTPSESTAQSMIVRLNWRFPDGSPTVTVDASAFLLNAHGVVCNDLDWVCYHQPDDRHGAVVRQASGSPDQCGFQVTRSAVPGTVQRILFCLTLEATAAVPVFNAAAALHVVVSDAETGAILIDHHSSSQLGTENGLMVAELYRDGNDWVFRSVDQGFAGRLVALAGHLGVRIMDEEFDNAVSQKNAPVQPVSGQNQDCACRITALSNAGMTGCELLASLWDQKTALNPNSVIINLLNEDPLHKVRMLLRREHGCPMTTPEIQHTVQRELLR